MDSIGEILQRSRVIAVVGLSPGRPAYEVAQYLQIHGYRVIPVNPALSEALGEKAYPDLPHVPFPIDIVIVFRNPRYVPGLIDQAIQIKANAVWLQPGAVNPEAVARARSAGLETIAGLCIRTEHMLRASETESQ